MTSKIIIIIDLILNIILAISKIIIGYLVGSIALTTDGINNLNDGLSNVIGLIGEIVKAKPADKEHPFGHARFEYIASMIISMFIILTGLVLLKDGIIHIVHPQSLSYPPMAMMIIIGGIIVKLGIFVFNKQQAKHLHSSVLTAISYDAFSDVIASSAMLVAMIVENTSGLQLDGWIATIISIYILYSGIKVAKMQIDELLGKEVDSNLEKDIKDIIKKYPHIEGMHDLIVHNYGPNHKFATIHLCMDGSVDIYELHEIIDEIEREVQHQLGLEFLIHLDPVKLNDHEQNDCEAKLQQLLTNYPNITSYHDFRAVYKHDQSYIFFDLQLPYSTKIDIEEFSQKYLDLLEKSYQLEIAIDYI